MCPGLLPIKAAVMSSEHGSGSFAATKCIDGMITRDGGTGSSMCHTDHKDRSPTLTIELKGVYPVTSVVLYNREDSSWNRTSSIKIWVTNSPNPPPPPGGWTRRLTF